MKDTKLGKKILKDLGYDEQKVMMKKNQINFMRGLLKLKTYSIEGKEYVLTEDIGKLTDMTFRGK